MTNYLVTGGTGTFGQAFVRRLLAEEGATRIGIYSRDEQKQWAMRRAFNDDPRLRFLLGDVRDAARLAFAMRGTDTVVHAAALKIVPALEYNPGEAVKTNILGAMNVIESALASGSVRRVCALSTDKAPDPVNLYGATKLVAERLFVAANAYGGLSTRFFCVRYGNVAGSRGSIVPLWRELLVQGRCLQLTDGDMTRFWMTVQDAVALVDRALATGRGGEVFVPKLDAYRMLDLALAVTGGALLEVAGSRPGERLHETLISASEAPRAWDLGDVYAVYPSTPESPNDWKTNPPAGAVPVGAGFTFRSDTAPRLNVAELECRLHASGLADDPVGVRSPGAVEATQ